MGHLDGGPMMRDENYIKPSERHHNDTCQYVTVEPHGSYPCRCTVASHAVADDIARELAEELRACLPLIAIDGPSCDALDRYDRVMGSK